MLNLCKIIVLAEGMRTSFFQGERGQLAMSEEDL